MAFEKVDACCSCSTSYNFQPSSAVASVVSPNHLYSSFYFPFQPPKSILGSFYVANSFLGMRLKKPMSYLEKLKLEMGGFSLTFLSLFLYYIHF